jgi:hypothetical protein
MLIAVAVIAALLAFNFFGLYRFAMKKRINLSSYAVYLLLSDQIREGHKAKLIEFIRAQQGDALALTNATMDAIENMADELSSKGSILAAHSMIAQVRK